MYCSVTQPSDLSSYIPIEAVTMVLLCKQYLFQNIIRKGELVEYFQFLIFLQC